MEHPQPRTSPPSPASPPPMVDLYRKPTSNLSHRTQSGLIARFGDVNRLTTSATVTKETSGIMTARLVRVRRRRVHRSAVAEGTAAVGKMRLRIVGSGLHMFLDAKLLASAIDSRLLPAASACERSVTPRLSITFQLPSRSPPHRSLDPFTQPEQHLAKRSLGAERRFYRTVGNARSGGARPSPRRHPGGQASDCRYSRQSHHQTGIGHFTSLLATLQTRQPTTCYQAILIRNSTGFDAYISSAKTTHAPASSPARQHGDHLVPRAASPMSASWSRGATSSSSSATFSPSKRSTAYRRPGRSASAPTTTAPHRRLHAFGSSPPPTRVCRSPRASRRPTARNCQRSGPTPPGDFWWQGTRGVPALVNAQNVGNVDRGSRLAPSNCRPTLRSRTSATLRRCSRVTNVSNGLDNYLRWRRVPRGRQRHSSLHVPQAQRRVRSAVGADRGRRRRYLGRSSSRRGDEATLFMKRVQQTTAIDSTFNSAASACVPAVWALLTFPPRR